jgi:hypothetical protein
MKSSEYLYDVNPSAFKDLKYTDALEKKRHLANALLVKLVHDENMKDNDRINAVIDAVRFNDNLIKEITR